MTVAEFLKLHKLSVGDNASLLLEKLGIENPDILSKLEGEIGEIAKMSKSKGNIVDPEEAVERYGADTVRLYILFAGPPQQDFEWTEEGIQGAYRFLNRLWNFITEREEDLRNADDSPARLKSVEGKGKELRREIHTCLSAYLRDMEERYQFNTAIAQAMKLLGHLMDFKPSDEKDMGVLKEGVKILLLMLAPITPHICEELWHRLGFEGLIVEAPVPEVDQNALLREKIELPVQVNGKLRSRIVVDAEAGEEQVKETALSDEKVRKHINGKQVRKVIYIKGKLVNIVVG